MSTVSTPPHLYVEMDSGRRGYSLRPLRVLFPYVFLAILTFALGYAAFQSGGVEFSNWIPSLLCIGLTSVLYLLQTRSSPAVSFDNSWLGSVTLLLPLYVAFQLLPLPVWLLRLISPERAHLVNNLGVITSTSIFAPLSITPANTSAFLLTVLGYVLVFVMVRDLVSRLADTAPWAVALPLILIAATEAGIGLVQAASDADVQGTYGSFDHFAGLLEMVLPFAVMYGILNVHRESEFASLQITNALKACIAFAAAVLIFLAALYSTSRTGTVATLSGLLVMGAFAVYTRGGKLWPKTATVSCLAIAALLVIIYFAPNTLIMRFGSLLVDKQSRWPIWHDTIHLISAFPLFGCGLGNYGTAFLRFQTADLQNAYDYAHNDYLQLASELGFVGFVILATAAFFVFRTAMRSLATEPDRRKQYLALACIGGLSAIALHSLADFNLYIPANAFVLAWIAGMATAGNRTRVQHRFTLPASLFLVAASFLWLIFNTAFQADTRAERTFCRFGMCNTDAVIAAEALKHGGFAPTAILQTALSRDSGSALRWADLGDTYLRTNDIAEARYCFSRAANLAPHIPPVLMRVATFYYVSGETKQALRLGAAVLGSTDADDAIVFDSYNAHQVQASDVLRYGMPQGSRATQAYLRYLISLPDLNNADVTWRWLVSHRAGDESIAIEYANFLFGQQQYEAAAQSWASHLGSHRSGYLESNWIYNGTFEAEPSSSPFDWHVDKLPRVDVSQDRIVFHRGRQSLRIEFDGKENLTYNHVSETAFVRPGDYRFEAFVRCANVTRDQGVGFHIFDPETPVRVDLKTPQLVGTQDWTKLEANVSVPSGTRILQIQVMREPTWKLFDNATTGTVWIDDVKLSKID
jgi:putative inorganic carbon (hco3(-)) transporter